MIKQKIIKHSKFFFLISSLSAVLIFLNIEFLRSIIIGSILSLLFLGINSFWLGEFLSKIIFLEKPMRVAFGFFAFLFLMTFFLSLGVAFTAISPLYFLIVLILSSILSYYLYFKFSPKPRQDWGYLEPHVVQGNNQSEHLNENNLEPEQGFSLSKWFLIIYAVFYLICLFFLFKARTNDFILYPWQNISPLFLYFFLATTFLALMAVFSKYRVRIILLIIISYSFLIHSYLPIIYPAGFGGDKWRHIAAERLLMQGEQYAPTLVGNGLRWQKIGPLQIPSVFISGSKTSYSYEWAMVSGISWTTGIDVFYVDLFLEFILWSIFIPLFLYKLGQFLARKKPFWFLFAFLANVFYSFQLLGAMTVPVGLGFLNFIFVLLFYIRSWKNKNKSSLILALILTLCFYLNYLLYLVLLFEFILLTLIFKNLLTQKKYRFFAILAVIFFLFFIPLIDYFAKFSQIKSGISPSMIFSHACIFLKNLFAYAPAHAIISTTRQSNIIYGQISQPFLRFPFFHFLKLPFIFSTLIWGFAIYGFLKAKKSIFPSLIYLFGILAIILTINQFVGEYLAEGVRLLSKRLDIAIAFFILILLAWGIYVFLTKENRFLKQKIKIILICLFLSVIIGSVYISGPYDQIVTPDEKQAAEILWQKIKNQSGPYCVLANTWPLLALEAESGRKIINGNFPVYFNYEEPERVKLFQAISENPDARYLNQALEITKSADCYLMTEKRFWPKQKQDEILLLLKKIFSEPEEQVGEVYIFHYISSQIKR